MVAENEYEPYVAFIHTHSTFFINLSIRVEIPSTSLCLPSSNIPPIECSHLCVTGYLIPTLARFSQKIFSYNFWYSEIHVCKYKHLIFALFGLLFFCPSPPKLLFLVATYNIDGVKRYFEFCPQLNSIQWINSVNCSLGIYLNSRLNWGFWFSKIHKIDKPRLKWRSRQSHMLFRNFGSNRDKFNLNPCVSLLNSRRLNSAREIDLNLHSKKCRNNSLDERMRRISWISQTL